MELESGKLGLVMESGSLMEVASNPFPDSIFVQRAGGGAWAVTSLLPAPDSGLQWLFFSFLPSLQATLLSLWWGTFIYTALPSGVHSGTMTSLLPWVCCLLLPRLGFP